MQQESYYICRTHTELHLAKTLEHLGKERKGGGCCGGLSVSGWVDNETDRNWMTHSFELGWSERIADAALTFHRQSPLDTVTKTVDRPPPSLAAISFWLIKLSNPANKASCPPAPSAPGRKDDPNVDALSVNIDWIGPPAPGLNANKIARPFLTAAAEGGAGGGGSGPY